MNLQNQIRKTNKYSDSFSNLILEVHECMCISVYVHQHIQMDNKCSDIHLDPVSSNPWPHPPFTTTHQLLSFASEVDSYSAFSNRHVGSISQTFLSLVVGPLSGSIADHISLQLLYFMHGISWPRRGDGRATMGQHKCSSLRGALS